MFCPKCRSEFVEGVSFCHNCELELVAELPPEDIFASPEAMAKALEGKELEAVVTGPHGPVRDMQRELARARIPTVIAGEPGNEAQPAMHARFFLLVDGTQVEEVRSFFKRRLEEGLVLEGLMLREGAVSDGDTCPACGAALSGEVSECPECGLGLGDPDAA